MLLILQHRSEFGTVSECLRTRSAKHVIPYFGELPLQMIPYFGDPVKMGCADFVNPGSQIYQRARKKLCQRLRDARKSAGLKQAQVCALMGKSKSFLSKVETNERRLDGIELLMFVTIYDKELSYFSIALKPVISETLKTLATFRKAGTPQGDYREVKSFEVNNLF